MPYKNIRVDTLAQRRILSWLDHAFSPGAVTVEFTSGHTAVLTDKTGRKEQVTCNLDGDIAKEAHTWKGN